MNASRADRSPRIASGDTAPCRPLVLVHGFLGSPDDWSAFESALEQIPQAPPTVRADLRTAAQELIAAGTTRPTLPQLACALLGSLRRDPRLRGGFDVVGYSMGGRVALEWLVGQGESQELRLDIRLLLASAQPGIEDDAERARRASVDAHLAQRLAEIDAAADGAKRSACISSLLADWYSMPMFTPLASTRAFDDVLKRRREDLESDGIARCWSAIVAGCSPGTNESRWHTLEAAGEACMVVTGELDARYFAVVKRSAHMGIATRVIKDAGHALPIEQPEALARLAAAWAVPLGRTLAVHGTDIA